MAIQHVRGIRALVAGLLVVLLVVAGAIPAAAGGAGARGSGQVGPGAAGARGGGGHDSGVTAQQVSGGSKASARKDQGRAARPARQRADARPRGADRGTTATAKPSPARAGEPAAARSRSRGPAAGPHREVDDAADRRPTSKSPADGAHVEVLDSAVAPVTRAVNRPERPGRVRATARPVAVVVASAGDPSAALFPAPLSTPVEVAAVDPGPRRLWPTLPGPMGHPAFPGLLVAVLLGFVALGLRGDRRDPKLAAAAIDDRDDRARFR